MEEKYLPVHSLKEGSMVQKNKCNGDIRIIEVWSWFCHSEKPCDVQHITASLQTLDVPLKDTGVVGWLYKNSKSL